MRNGDAASDSVAEHGRDVDPDGDLKNHID